MGQKQEREIGRHHGVGHVAYLGEQHLVAALLVVGGEHVADGFDDRLDVLVVGGPGHVVFGGFARAAHLAGRVVVERLRPAGEAAGRLGGVVLSAALPPRPAFDLPEFADEFVQRFGRPAGVLAFEPTVHLVFQRVDWVEPGWPLAVVAGVALVAAALQGEFPRFEFLLVGFVRGEEFVRLHAQEDARVEQRPAGRPEVHRVEAVQERVRDLHDVDVPRVDGSLLGELDEEFDRFDLVVVRLGDVLREYLVHRVGFGGGGVCLGVGRGVVAGEREDPVVIVVAVASVSLAAPAREVQFGDVVSHPPEPPLPRPRRPRRRHHRPRRRRGGRRRRSRRSRRRPSRPRRGRHRRRFQPRRRRRTGYP